MGDATEALDAMVSDYNAGDWDAFAAKISNELTFSDHRGDTPAEFSGLRYFVGGVKQTVGEGFTRFEYDVIDTRGDHVVLARITVRTDDGDVDQRLAVYRFDRSRKLLRYDSYRNEDLTSARERLDELSRLAPDE
jgi:hypothetical protein